MKNWQEPSTSTDVTRLRKIIAKKNAGRLKCNSRGAGLETAKQIITRKVAERSEKEQTEVRLSTGALTERGVVHGEVEELLSELVDLRLRHALYQRHLLQRHRQRLRHQLQSLVVEDRRSVIREVVASR